MAQKTEQRRQPFDTSGSVSPACTRATLPALRALCDPKLFVEELRPEEATAVESQASDLGSDKEDPFRILASLSCIAGVSISCVSCGVSLATLGRLLA